MTNLLNVISGLGRALPDAVANEKQIGLGRDKLIADQVAAMQTMQQARREAEDKSIKDAKESLGKYVEDLAARESELLVGLMAEVDPAQFGEAATNAHKDAQSTLGDLVEAYNERFGRKVFSAAEFNAMLDAKVKKPLSQAAQARQAADKAKAESEAKIAGAEATLGRQLTMEEREAIGAGAEIKSFRSTDPNGNPIEVTALLGKDGTVQRVIGQGPIQQAGTSVTIDQRSAGLAEGEFGKKIGEGLFNIASAGERAAFKLASIGRINQLLGAYEAAGGETGALAELKTSLGSVLNSLGEGFEAFASKIGVSRDQTELAQALQGATRQLIGGLIGTGPDAVLPANLFTEADRQVVLSTVPQISDLGGGFRLKALAYQRVAERAAQISDRLWELRAQPGMDAEKVYAQLQKEFRNPNNALFTADELEAFEKAPRVGQPAPQRPVVPVPTAAPSPVPGPTTGVDAQGRPAMTAPVQPPQIRNVEEYNALPDGVQYLDPNGVLRIKGGR